MIDYLTSKANFQYFLMVCTFGSIILYYCILYILLKKGYKMRVRKKQLVLAIIVIFPIALLPYILHPRIPVALKFTIILFGIGVGLLHYVGLIRTGKWFRKKFGIDAPEDRADEEEEDARRKKKEERKKQEAERTR